MRCHQRSLGKLLLALTLLPATPSGCTDGTKKGGFRLTTQRRVRGLGGAAPGRPGGGWAPGRARRGAHKMEIPGTPPPFRIIACVRRRPAFFEEVKGRREPKRLC